jgi:hypothetical protein
MVVDQATGKTIMTAGGAKDGVDLPPPPVGTRWVRPGDPGYHPGQPPLVIAASEADKRIIDLEMKLKSLLSEVEKLRQERKPAAPNPVDSESKPQSNGTAPLEKSLYVNQLYKAVVAAKAPEETTVLLERLRAETERQKAQAAALAAERDAGQAKLKMLEEEIAKLKRWQIEANSSPAKPYPTKP